MTEQTDIEASKRFAHDAIRAMQAIASAGEPKKKTLGDILSSLQQADDGLLSFTEEQQRSVVEDLKDKVDSYKYIDDKFDAEITRLDEQMKMIAEVKKSLQNNKAKLRELMAFHMVQNNFEKLPGQMFQVSLVRRNDVDLTITNEPNEELLLEYGPQFINKTYSWNTTSLKRAVKADPEAYAKFGTFKEKSHVQFTVRKNL